VLELIAISFQTRLCREKAYTFSWQGDIVFCRIVGGKNTINAVREMYRLFID
jgi:hypothetical protein